VCFNGLEIVGDNRLQTLARTGLCLSRSRGDDQRRRRGNNSFEHEAFLSCRTLYLNPDGAVVRWAVETGSTNALFRRGWRKDSLRAGDRITVDAFRAKDGSNTANASTVKLPDGRQVSGASSREGGQ
jgi:hypothetical protein